MSYPPQVGVPASPPPSKVYPNPGYAPAGLFAAWLIVFVTVLPSLPHLR